MRWPSSVSCDCGLTPEQIATELAFKLPDRAGERGLGNVTFLRGAREIKRARHGEEVVDLMHFHKWT